MNEAKDSTPVAQGPETEVRDFRSGKYSWAFQLFESLIASPPPYRRRSKPSALPTGITGKSAKLMLVDDAFEKPEAINALHEVRSPSPEVQSLDREAQEKEGEES